MHEATAKVLRNLHYEVLEAKHGAVALAKAIGVLNAEVPVIFVTGYNKQKILEDEALVGNSKVLNKPFSFEALSQTLGSLIKREFD